MPCLPYSRPGRTPPWRRRFRRRCWGVSAVPGLCCAYQRQGTRWARWELVGVSPSGWPTSCPLLPIREMLVEHIEFYDATVGGGA